MSKSNRVKFKCLDCSVDTGRIYEHYFIETELWLSAVGSKTGMLCIGCLEKRIGRRLKPIDFPKVTINDPRMTTMSSRLMSRILKG